MQPLGAAAAPAASSAAPAAAGDAQHALEQRLVDRLCTPAGLRAAPSGEDLRAFVEGLAPLDGPAVARLLQRKLVRGGGEGKGEGGGDSGDNLVAGWGHTRSLQQLRLCVA
mgnify:CR=1 FL=1